jgi:hypothetical protein
VSSACVSHPVEFPVIKEKSQTHQISFSLSALNDEFDKDFEHSHTEEKPNQAFEKSLYATTQLLDFLDTTASPMKISTTPQSKNIKVDVTSSAESMKSQYCPTMEYSLDNLPPLMFSSRDISCEKDLFADVDPESKPAEGPQKEAETQDSFAASSFSYLDRIESESIEHPVKTCLLVENELIDNQSEFKLPDLANFESRGRTPKRSKIAAGQGKT